ncbi:MAG TPA: hypothetical protein DC057_19365, partial [Spirochaetia bacterium]|nr:hypothetical protein [Spirochaetia bacterium]
LEGKKVKIDTETENIISLCKIANNGYYAIGEIINLEKLKSSIKVYNNYSELIFEDILNALMIDFYISDNLDYLGCQFANSKDKLYSGLFFLYNINKSKLEWKNDLGFWHPEKLNIDIDNNCIDLLYEKKKYKYDLNNGNPITKK